MRYNNEIQFDSFFGILLFFLSCNDDSTDYLNSKTLYKFSENDILIYKGEESIDTFKVSMVNKRMEKWDHTYYHEILDVRVPNINQDCNPYCSGFFIKRIANNSTHIFFRNADIFINHPVSKCKIGSLTIDNVYNIELTSVPTDISKNIKTLFYHHNYGIIAYELISGERLELEEKCFKE